MTTQPKITNGDYFVIDGEGGTRKVPAQELLVLSGTSTPTSSIGVDGQLYAQIEAGKVVMTYIRLPQPAGWQPVPKGGSYMHEFTITERVVSTSTTRCYETPVNQR